METRRVQEVHKALCYCANTKAKIHRQRADLFHKEERINHVEDELRRLLREEEARQREEAARAQSSES